MFRSSIRQDKLGMTGLVAAVGAGLLLLFVLISIVVSRIDKSARADDARKKYLEACRQREPSDDCEARLEANHDECFFVNDVPGTRFSKGYFRANEYEKCVSEGFASWQARRHGEQRARERERRELGLPR